MQNPESSLSDSRGLCQLLFSLLYVKFGLFVLELHMLYIDSLLHHITLLY